MKRSTVAAVVLACAFCSGAGPVVAADPVWVNVYDATQLPLHRYTVVKRIWAGTWHSSFWVSTYDSASEAIAALTSKAADEGANGVINLHCLNDAGGSGSSYFCYGLAIKLN